MNRALKITIDKHADDYILASRQNIQNGYCCLVIPLLAGALRA